MARILPNNSNTNFLTKYGVESFCNCEPERLTIKVWDLYGTAPKENDDINTNGEYIAAVVMCDPCNKSIELHRKQLMD